ncbi:hypothetical protein [Pseudomonas fluvialis]|uniref:hypothetical protein n=1 Tax=Pseudomonas fluvialis TaxID=1793966 RepID=UPI0035B17C8F
MAEWRLMQARDGVYERLLQRLALALERAEQNLQLSPGGEAELELTGLSPSETELIRAYLRRDLHWLRGWHAAAEELAQLERQQLPPLPGRRPAAPLDGRGQLCCALCGAVLPEARTAMQACAQCGSTLFRLQRVPAGY